MIRHVLMPLQFQGNTYPLVFHEDDHISQVCRKTSTFYESELLRDVQKRAVTGVYVDVGAHVGNHTVFFARECPAVAVIAIEPSRRNLRLLQSNVDRNGGGGHVTIVPNPVGAPNQRGRLVEMPGNTGMDRVVLDPNGALLWTLDQIALIAHVIKIDVEGMELDVLRGAQRLLAGAPLLILEAITPEAFAAQLDFLEPLGYVPGQRFNATPTFIWEAKK